MKNIFIQLRAVIYWSVSLPEININNDSTYGKMLCDYLLLTNYENEWAV